MSEIKISLFKPGRNGKIGVKPHPTDFYTEMQKIQDGTHYPVIKKLREITDEVERRNYKASKLEAYTISAVCPSYREIKGAIPSGLLAIDLDPKNNLEVSDWGAVRDQLFELPEVVAAFKSASGNGVAFVVKINPNQFKDVFYSIKDELSDNFGLNIDPGCHDIVRLRFASFDPEIKIRLKFDEIPLKEPSSLYLEQKREKEQSVLEYTGEVGSADCDRAWSYAIAATNKRVGGFMDGQKHSYLVALAGFCNVIGMAQEYCESRVADAFLSGTDIGIDRLLKPVKNVYRTYKHKHNTYVQTVSNRKIKNKIVGEVVANYVRKGIKPSAEDMDAIAQKCEANIELVNEVVPRVMDEYSEEQNIEAKQENATAGFKQFWYVDEDSKVAISKMAFRDYLIQNGVFRYEVEKKWIIIQIKQNIVEEIQRAHLKQIVFQYIEKMREYEVWEVLANRVGSVFADEYLEIIPTKKIDFYRDAQDSICLFYLNGVVRVTGTSIDLIPWDKFEGTIWRQQILGREITLQQREKNDSSLEVFFRNVTNQDNARLLSLCSAIGYLIHLYKNKGSLPAVILNDEEISDTPAGGTGKGLIMDCVGRYRNVEAIDAKLFDFSDRFRYQNITLDTQVVFFDDAPKNFNFEKLFSTMSQNFEVEQKGGLKFKLPFSISPKIAIATNYAIQGTSASYARRKFELELYKHYSETFTPAIEFKKQLFDDYTPQEWIKADNFIFNACAVYLQKGLIKQTLINQPIKQLYAAVSHEFVEFMNEEFPGLVSTSVRYDQADMYRAYQHLYPSKLGAKTFYHNVEMYLEYLGVVFTRGKSGDVRYFYVEAKPD